MAMYFPSKDGELYSATVADFSASDALIIRDRLRTEQYELKHLNGRLKNRPKLAHNYLTNNFFFIPFRRAQLCELFGGRGARLLLLQGDGGGTHQLRKGATNVGFT